MYLTVSLIGLTALFYRAYRNTFRPNVNRVHIELKQSDRFSRESLRPIRLLHLSDLHMENVSVRAEEIVTRFRQEALDLIAITGDFLDRERNIAKAVDFVAKLQQLHPVFGTYAVFGNHDYLLPPHKLAQFKEELKRIGCHVLQNESRTVNVGGTDLHIIGVDDYASRKSDLAKAFDQVGDKGIRLVLTHDPNLVLKMEPFPFDYLLAGHFHGGQIHWPKPYHLRKMGELPRMNIVKGLHRHNGRPFYISEGLGQTGLNIRLRSRPEITLHTLAGKSETSLERAEVPGFSCGKKAAAFVLD